MNEIGHKIGIAVKKDCQVTISPLLQHMLGFKRTIFSQARSRSRLGGRRNQGTKVSVRVLPTGRTENGGRRSITNVENRTGRRKRRRDDDQSPLVLRRFQTVEIDIRDDTGVKIPFERGRVVVTVHCRKRKESYLE